MLEMIVNPKKAERRPWEMLIVGFFYSSLALLLVNLAFSKDAVLSQYSGILVVTFTVMFSTPFIYYTIKLEENRITPKSGSLSLLYEHRNALWAFLFLFVGFLIAFSLWYIVFAPVDSFKPQIETYCAINKAATFKDCTAQYGIKQSGYSTGAVTSFNHFMAIFENNLWVLVFTLMFSLIFGAGAIFVLVWNASVIAAAIGIFAKLDISALPLGFFRYMAIHGMLEIAAYFIVALAGGIVSIAVIKHEYGTEKFWEVLQDSLNLIILAVIILFVAAILEVFITPLVFQ